MNARPGSRNLSTRNLEAILAVTSKLAAPFDLRTMLGEVVNAAKQVLGAQGGSVWLHDEATGEAARGRSCTSAPHPGRSRAAGR